MKKIIIIILMTLSAAKQVVASQQDVTQISGVQSSIGALKAQVNPRLDATQSNFTELYGSVSTLTSALNGKASISCFANSTAAAACGIDLDWLGTEVGDNLGSATAANISSLFSGTGDCLRADGTKGACGGISSWTDISTLLTGTGTYVKADGTTGDPTGTITTGDGVAAAMANALDGTGGLASKAAIDALPNIVFGTGITVVEDTPSAGTDTVSIDVDSTPTSGSAKPLTSGGAYTALSGKENADPTIIKVAEVNSQSKFEALVGWTLPSGGGVGGYVTAPVYSDSTCTAGTYSFHATYGVVYCKASNTWDYQVVSGSSLAWASWNNPMPATYTLTIDGTGWNGTDLISVGGSTYTADGTKAGLSGATAITVTPDTGREATCSGTGITGSSSPYSADMSSNMTISCTFSDISTTSYSDNFNRANGNLTTPWLKPADATNIMQITDNKACGIGGDSLALYNDSVSDNQYSQAYVQSPNEQGVMVRVTDGNNWYLLRPAGLTTVNIEKSVNGAWEYVHDNITTASMSGGATLRLEASGTTLTAKVNGTTVWSGTDASLHSGKVAIWSKSSSSCLDDWAGGNL